MEEESASCTRRDQRMQPSSPNDCGGALSLAGATTMRVELSSGKVPFLVSAVTSSSRVAKVAKASLAFPVS
jgi:hypothetical protein